VPDDLDFVERHGLTLGLTLRRRTVFVEGTTDEDLFRLAVTSERQRTGIDLTSDGLAVIAAGTADNGGVDGVVRQLTGFRFMATSCFLPDGRQKYRFVGLFDDDRAGREAVRRARELDRGAIEYRDVFRMRPVMPLHTDRDPSSLQKRFEAENLPYKGIDWEMEDLLPESFHQAFVESCPGAVAEVTTAGGKTHRDLSRDGKAKFHRFIKEHAVHADLKDVIATVRALRFYLGMPAL
jgi:hypothetical protein